MTRAYLAIGAVVVLLAAIVLYVFARGDDGKEQSASHAPTTAPVAQADRGSPAPQLPSADATDRGGGSRGAAGSNNTREYTVGGVRIRDHRAGQHAPTTVAPTVHPPGGRKIPSELTSGVAQKVRAVVEACAANIPPASRGDKPRAEGEKGHLGSFA